MNIATTILTNPGFDHIPANIHHGSYLKRKAKQDQDVYRQELENESAEDGCLCSLFCLVIIGGCITGLVFLAKWMLGI